MKKLVLSLMLFAGIYGIAAGQQATKSATSDKADKDANWEKIGEKTVDLSMERGIFNWNTDREKSVNANEKYSAIKFKAKDAPVSLTTVEVEFEDGKKQNLDINTPVQVNMESKVVQLNNQAELDKITFNYAKNESAAEDKAKIEVWGLKAKSSSGMGQRNTESDRMDRSGTDRSNTDIDRSGTNRTGTGSDIDRSGTDRSSTGTGTGTGTDRNEGDQRNR